MNQLRKERSELPIRIASTISNITCVLFVFLILPTHVNAEFKGDFQLLKMISMGMKANVEAIRTWSGKASIVDHRRRNVSLDIESTAVAFFAHDALRNAVRWNFNVLNPESSGQEPRSLIYTSSQMIRDGEVFKFGPNYQEQVKSVWSLYVNAAEEKPLDGLTNEFHPMYFLEAVRKEDLPGFLASVCEEANGPTKESKGVLVEVKRDGNQILLLYDYDDGVYNHYHFDTSKGCNLVKYDGGGAGVNEQWIFGYAEYAEIFVPSRWKYENAEVTSAGRNVRFSREVVFEQQSVNEPLSESEFSFESMGLRKGDFVHDTIRGIDYKFLQSDDDNRLDAETKGSYRFLLIVINLVFLSLIVLYMYITKRRGHR